MPATKALSSDTKIVVATAGELESHFDQLSAHLWLEETEHTWLKISNALLYIQAIVRGGATKHTEFTALLKEASQPINNALLSERTKLSGTAGDLLNSIAPRMAERFEPLVAVFVPTLLQICARTNKVAVKRAEKVLQFIVKHCRSPLIVAYLKEAIKDKGQGLRCVAASTLVLVVEFTEKERLTRKVGDIEACIRSGATDSCAEVRKEARRLFELYVEVWPERVEVFTKPMTPTIRRYLSLPKTGALVVEIPDVAEVLERTTAASSRAPPAGSRQEDMLVPATNAPPSRTAPAYNFFPDLTKPSASSSAAAASTSKAPGFSMNDASYGKRGLFADQIAAARNARLARMPSFNFDDVAKASTESAPAPMIKRQPSFDQLRSQAIAPGATFRVPRFDVVGNDGRSRSAHASEAAPFMHRDINATTPSFAAASGLHGKSALLAAYKQAFVVEVPGASSTSSRDRQNRDQSERPSKHSERRREKTVTVRFEPEFQANNKEDDPTRLATDAESGAANEMPRSKSAPQIAVQMDAHSDIPTEAAARSGKVNNNNRPSKGDNVDWQDSDSDDGERPRTPPERMLHAQTPRTGVKASRVPAQRVAVPSAVKVSAMRVAVPTPSVKIAAGRVANAANTSVESSPMPKARADPRTPRAQPLKAGALTLPEAAKDEAGKVDEGKAEMTKMQEPQDENKEGKAPEVEQVKKQEETEQRPAPAPAPIKKSTGSAVQTSRPTVKPVTARPTPSATLAAKARLEARAAAAKPTAAAAEGKKVVQRPVVPATKPTTVRKPISSSTIASTMTQAKPAATAASTVKSSRPVPTTKTLSAATSSAVARAKLAAANKPCTVATAPPSSRTATMKKVEASNGARVSTLTASTASTRNKVVPAAAIKKFQPKPSSLASSISSSTALTAQSRQKSSIATSLAAKSKILGARAGASDKAIAVKKAGASMAAKIEKHRRASAMGVGQMTKKVETAALEEPGAIEGAVAEHAEAKEEVESDAHVAVDESAEALVETERKAEADGVTHQESEEEKTTSAEEEESGVVNGSESSADTDQAGEVTAEQEHTSTANVDVSTSSAQSDVFSEQETIADEQSQQIEGDVSEAAVTPISVVATPVKQPLVADPETPSVKVRTPLSSKDCNIPKSTPIGSANSGKVASPLLPSSHVKSTPTPRSTPLIPSPLRRSTPSHRKAVLVPVQFEPESSFEESESDSEAESTEEPVVQLQFRPRQAAVQAQQHMVVGCSKQLVLGLDSSDDSGMMEAGEGDETVLLEQDV